MRQSENELLVLPDAEFPIGLDELMAKLERARRQAYEEGSRLAVDIDFDYVDGTLVGGLKLVRD